MCEAPGCSKRPGWNPASKKWYRFCWEHGQPREVPEPETWTVTQLPTVPAPERHQKMRVTKRARPKKMDPPRRKRR